MSHRVDELAERLGCSWQGDGAMVLSGCASLQDAGTGDLSFVSNPRYLAKLADSRAGCIVVAPQVAEQHPGRTLLIAENPYLAFRDAMVLLHGWRLQPAPGISAQAYVDATAEVAEFCTIRPFAYVAPRTKIGRRVILYPGVYVGKDVVIGDDSILYPNVVVYDRCVLGSRVTLHAGCSIGHDGFGYATAPGSSVRTERAPTRSDGEVMHHKIPQAGNVVIEDDVEIGANCSIDRATVGSTVIGCGTKFSNNVVIGHGCRVGEHNLFVADVGLAGSVTTGKYVVLGGQVGVNGHITLGDGAQVAASSKVLSDLAPGKQYGGTPAVELSDAKRIVLQQQRLPDLAATIKRLEKRIASLEARLSSTNADA
jgi:UDP-3-O-[3-hydroxymyristoyl] glucosamine N-acyltransferase